MKSNSEIALSERVDVMDKVAEAWLRNESVAKIARDTGLSRIQVKNAVDEWIQVAIQDEGVKELAKQSLIRGTEHYSILIDELWALVRRNEGIDDKTVATSLKTIGDLEAKRIEFLQKAGMYDDSAMGAEIAENERKMQILYKVIKETINECEHCRLPVMSVLAQLMDDPEIPD